MSQPVKVLSILAAVLVVLIGIRFGIAALNPPDDQALIREALQESIKASREGRPGGVIELLSKDLRVNETQVGINRQVTDFIRNSKPDVKLDNDKAIVTGDKATITSSAQLELQFLGATRQVPLKEVTLRFEKENAREWLIFPTKKWRLTEVEVPDSTLSEFTQ